MGVASRKTWLEKQTDDVQLAVLAMDDAGRTLEEMRAELQERFEIDVPASTLHNAIKIFREGIGHEEKLAALLARRNKRFFADNPDVDPHSIARYQLTLAGSRIDASKLDEKAFFSAAQMEAIIDLRRQELELKRQANDLRKQKLEQENKKLELQIQRMKQQTEEAIDEAEQKTKRGESLSVADINRIRERVFGLPEIAAGPAD